MENNENKVLEQLAKEMEEVKKVLNNQKVSHDEIAEHKFETSEKIDQIYPALLKFHKEIGKVTMDKINPYFNSKYADLSTILGTVTKPLSDNGLFLLQIPMNAGERDMVVNTRLIHGESGQFISVYSVTLKKGDNAQNVIGTSTYLRRNSISSLLAIVTDVDEDANDVEGTKPHEAQQTQTQTTQTAPRRRAR